MGFHAVYTTPTYQSVGWAIYQFLTDGSQDVTQVVNDGTAAVWMDLTETDTDHDVTPGNFGWGTPTQADAFGDGSFIVLEPRFANASGDRRWQVKIERDSNEWYVTASPNGGFSTGSGDFGSAPLTALILWWNLTIAATDELYLSSTDDGVWTDPAGVTQKYGYFRALVKDASAPTTALWGLYAGGYVPFDKAHDTDPFVLLGQKPYVASNATLNSWGYQFGNSNNSNNTPLENGGAVSSLVGAGWAFLSCNQLLQVTQRSQTRAGVEIEAPVYVHATKGVSHGEVLGFMHSTTMVGISTGIVNWTVNVGGTRLSLEDLSHSWAP